MKRVLFALALVSFALASGSCNRHSWEDSKVLYEKHGSGHDDDGDKHHNDGDGDGDGHDKDGDKD